MTWSGNQAVRTGVALTLALALALALALTQSAPAGQFMPHAATAAMRTHHSLITHTHKGGGIVIKKKKEECDATACNRCCCCGQALQLLQHTPPERAARMRMLVYIWIM